MKDPYNMFIDENVYLTKIKYYDLMFETKRIFFEYLQDGKSLEEFQKETERIWKGIDHTFMKKQISKLEEMIKQRDLKDRQILNPNAEHKEVYKLVPESDFRKREEIYKKNIDKYFKGREQTIEKDYIDKKSYLTDIVDKYDNMQQTIPYYNKNGTIHSYHNIASYSSMLYNTNLTRAGWNRTMYDANLLGEDLLYLPAHTFACPMCQSWQGRVYSKSGKRGTINGVSYESKEDAINGGVGHPNCRHQWLIYWDSEMLQENTYNSEEWTEKYKAKQKLRAVKLEISKLRNDVSIYKTIGNQEMVDKTEGKLKKLNEVADQLQLSL